MTRESKMTIKQINTNTCDIYCESRDNGGEWIAQGVIPVRGTMAEVAEKRIANQLRWGWTFIGAKGTVLTFRKEF